MSDKMTRDDINEQWENLGVDPDSVPAEVYNMTAKLYDQQMAEAKNGKSVPDEIASKPEPEVKPESTVRVGLSPEQTALYARGFASGLGLGLLAGGAIVIMIYKMKDGGNEDD